LMESPDDSFGRLVERRERCVRRRRLSAFTVAVVAALVALGGVGVLLADFDRGSRGVGSGWEPDRKLVLQPGEFFYLRVTSSEAEDGWVRDLETWWASDGSGEVRNRSTRQDKYPYPSTGTYAPGSFPTWLDRVPSLSTDPEVLATQLRDATFGWEGLLLETPYAAPELRAAVFEVASGLDGITVIEDMRDPVGRRAVALEWSERANGEVSTWRTYFDPGTHQLLAWTFASSRGGSAWILVESAIVEAAGDAPEPDEWLAPPLGRAAP
jgi:hypothetical protein